MAQAKPTVPVTDRALLSVDELGVYLGISENYARKLIDEAPFETIPLGRLRKVYRRSVDAWLEDQARQNREEREERESMMATMLNGRARIASGRKR